MFFVFWLKKKREFACLSGRQVGLLAVWKNKFTASVGVPPTVTVFKRT
jgi:hypothetical protein